MVSDILHVPEAANRFLLKLYSLSFCDATLSWVIPCDHCSSSYVESYYSTLLNVRDPGFVFLLITFLLLLGWCKSNCSFALLNFAIWYWNIFLNKCGYAIYHFKTHFLPFFFANDLLHTVYFVFILDYRNDIRQKVHSSDFFFLFEFKMGCKAVETTRNINNTFGPRTANEHTVQGCFKFCKGDKSLEDEECSDQPLKLTMTNWEPSSKLILLQLHKKLPKNSTSTILWSFGICSKWERVKMLYKWVPQELTENREIVIVFYATTMNHFSIKL